MERVVSWQNAWRRRSLLWSGFFLGKKHGGDAGASGRVLSWRLGKMRGGGAGACGEIFVLAKRVAVTQVLLVGFLSWRWCKVLACGKVFVLAKRLAVTQVLVVRFLSWRFGKTRVSDAGACGKVFVLAQRVAWQGSCLGETRGGDAGA